MRFYIELYCSKKEFPIDMRRVVLSIIKNALSHTADGRFTERYYKDKDPIQKDYCFSIVLPRDSKFLKDHIELSDNTIKVYFSTDDKNRTGLILMNTFLLFKNKKLPLENQNSCYISGIRQIKQDLILSSSVVLRTFQGSSILVRKHDKTTNRDKYLTVNDDNFIPEFENIIKYQASIHGFNQKDIDNIKIELFDDCKKVVVKNYDVLIDGTIGHFRLNATPDIIQYFYDVGMGARSSQGFGMLNLVEQ